MNDATFLIVYGIPIYCVMGLFFHVLIHNRGKNSLSPTIHRGLLTLASTIWFTPSVLKKEGHLVPAWMPWAMSDEVPPFWSFLLFGALSWVFWRFWGWMFGHKPGPPVSDKDCPNSE